MQIFMSYANDDKKKTASIVIALENEGFDVWWDQSLIPGKVWEDTLTTSIITSDIVCICLTPKSVKSEWVKKEVRIALDHAAVNPQVKIIPLMIEQCNILSVLSHIHCVDLTDFPQSAWGITMLTNHINGDKSIIDTAITVAGDQVSELERKKMPPWQNTFEALFEEKKYISRSLSSLQMHTHLSPNEVTQYCLRSNHLLLSPYVAPCSTSIPYFGHYSRLMVRYKFQYCDYLTVIKAYLKKIKHRKKNGKLKQSWEMIIEHYEQEFKVYNIITPTNTTVTNSDIPSSVTEEYANVALIIHGTNLDELCELEIDVIHNTLRPHFDKIHIIHNDQFTTVGEHQLNNILCTSKIVVMYPTTTDSIINYVAGFCHGYQWLAKKRVILLDENTDETLFVTPAKRFCDLVCTVEQLKELFESK